MTGDSRVDHDAGLIRGAKILGLVSKNKRRYLPEAVQAASRFYENLPLYADHPPKHAANKPRSSYDVYGWLEGITTDKATGMRGNIRVLTSTEMGRKVLEAAEKNPSLFALSHNATGDGYWGNDGVFIVEKITGARSVDTIPGGGAATTKSLFESTGQTMTKKLKQIIFESKCDQKRKLQLLEMPEDVLDTEAPVMDDEGMGDDTGETDISPEKAREMLAQAVAVLLQSDEGGDHEMASQIAKILHPDNAAGGDDAGDVEETGDEEMVTEESVKELCELSGVKPDKALLESLVAMKKSGHVRKHLMWMKEKKVGLRESVKSSTPGNAGKTARTVNGPGRYKNQTFSEFVETLNRGKK